MAGYYDKIHVVKFQNDQKYRKCLNEANCMLQNGWRILNTSPIEDGFLMLLVHTNPAHQARFHQ
jgi:hypothetical protein